MGTPRPEKLGYTSAPGSSQAVSSNKEPLLLYATYVRKGGDNEDANYTSTGEGPRRQEREDADSADGKTSGVPAALRSMRDLLLFKFSWSPKPASVSSEVDRPAPNTDKVVQTAGGYATVPKGDRLYNAGIGTQGVSNRPGTPRPRPGMEDQPRPPTHTPQPGSGRPTKSSQRREGVQPTDDRIEGTSIIKKTVTSSEKVGEKPTKCSLVSVMWTVIFYVLLAFGVFFMLPSKAAAPIDEEAPQAEEV